MVIPAVSLSRQGQSGAAGRWGVGAVHGDVDLRLHDQVALEEIELYADVLSAVAVADRPLTIAEIDEVLGVRQELPGVRQPASADAAP